MKNFPNKNWLGFPKGWKDLGRVKSFNKFMHGADYTSWEVHTLCHTRARLAREGDEIFKYCPKCMIQLDNYVKNENK